MALIAITGGIGSGKTTVSNLLIELGYPLIDTDQIARDIVKPNMKAYNQIKRTFGSEVIDDELELDRKKLGDIIFKDPIKRKKLNAIMHPIIRNEVLRQVFVNFLRGEKIIFIDVPLLYESKSLLGFVQKVIVVSCEREQQIERIIVRNSLSGDEAESRVSAQMDLKLKCKSGDYVIDNSKSVDDLKANLDRVLAQIKRANLHSRNLTIFRVLFFTFTIAFGYSSWQLLRLFAYGALKLLGQIPMYDIFLYVSRSIGA